MKPVKFEFFNKQFPDMEFYHGMNLLYYSDINYGKMLLHSHDFIEFMLIMEGNVSISADGTIYTLNTGDCVIVPRGLLHNTIIPETLKKYERFVLHIQSSVLEGIMKTYQFSVPEFIRKNKPFVVNCSPDDTFYLRFLLNQISYNYTLNDSYSLQCVKNKLFELFVFILRKNEQNLIQTVEHSNKVVSSVIDYINENFTLPEINTESIAMDHFVSEGHLTRLFRKYTGTTIYNYIIQKRLSYSITLMKKGESIHDACYKSGFSDYTSYLKAFKKTYHVTPSIYKSSPDNLHM